MIFYMKARATVQMCASTKPKVSELRNRFELIKASFAVEGIYFKEEELQAIEESIRKRHRGPGLLSSVKTLLEAKKRV